MTETSQRNADADRGMPSLAALPGILAAAPHRMMFFAGTSAVLVTMAWWAWYLLAVYQGIGHIPQPSVPAMWAHATLAQYGMLPMFMFGFLLTVFPRWMGQPALTRRHYVPVFVGVFGGYLVCHVGLLTSHTVLIVGLVMMLLGWTAGLLALGRVLLRNRGRDHHAISCYTALLFGAVGLLLFTAFVLGAPARCALVSIQIGTFGLLLPIFFTVQHRMLPFFSNNVVADYQMRRPRWSLPLLWLGMLMHLALTLGGYPQWLWLVDAPLALFFLGHWLAWQPWKCMRPGLLAVLHVGFMWLPIAFILFAAQSLILYIAGEATLGFAPLHALTIGYFGSTLVAMVTRVTEGHSGRPLQFAGVAWFAFVTLQVVAVARVGAELAADRPLWWTVAAFGWLLAFAPWVLRSLWIYLTPRRDGRPG